MSSHQCRGRALRNGKYMDSASTLPGRFGYKGSEDVDMISGEFKKVDESKKGALLSGLRNLVNRAAEHQGQVLVMTTNMPRSR